MTHWCRDALTVRARQGRPVSAEAFRLADVIDSDLGRFRPGARYSDAELGRIRAADDKLIADFLSAKDRTS